jgi:hypothetical protein
MKDAVLTPHAAYEIKRRGLDEKIIRAVTENPEQREQLREGRWVFQSHLEMGSPPKTYLVRVIVDTDRSPPEIVTAYRTTKITKYWRKEG